MNEGLEKGSHSVSLIGLKRKCQSGSKGSQEGKGSGAMKKMRLQVETQEGEKAKETSLNGLPASHECHLLELSGCQFDP